MTQVITDMKQWHEISRGQFLLLRKSSRILSRKSSRILSRSRRTGWASLLIPFSENCSTDSALIDLKIAFLHSVGRNDYSICRWNSTWRELISRLESDVRCWSESFPAGPFKKVAFIRAYRRIVYSFSLNVGVWFSVHDNGLTSPTSTL